MPHCGVIPSLRLTDALQGELGSLSLTLCLLQSIHSLYPSYIYHQQHIQQYNHNHQNNQESRKRGKTSTTKHAMSSNDDVDAWVAQLMQCKPLSELEVKKLCEKVSLVPPLTRYGEPWCCLDWDVVCCLVERKGSETYNGVELHLANTGTRHNDYPSWMQT